MKKELETYQTLLKKSINQAKNEEYVYDSVIDLLTLQGKLKIKETEKILNDFELELLELLKQKKIKFNYLEDNHFDELFIYVLNNKVSILTNKISEDKNVEFVKDFKI
ncbi:hypothetical protein [Sporolactobacillus inulinus]|uniref:Uncharacterized protein n=1 Tax=Sporolactobacillus inulinus CASD TaxID=1069536 RepID=A0A0U1QP22_9BACL|nr:hypothetical protein [Sporolactobacillus inulinus]KLI02532.1 hypothetical protein SINU_07615 [Sporolactobacillus inulinus CASD]GEB77713.1 hypothetical protein SIN01_20580 [Sporolactobacillus inulinus]